MEQVEKITETGFYFYRDQSAYGVCEILKDERGFYYKSIAGHFRYDPNIMLDKVTFWGPIPEPESEDAKLLQAIKKER